MTPDQSPLGKAVVYTEQYDPMLLFPIERKSARDAIGIGARLPFFGTDIWNAYELSWLNRRGKPQIAVATFFVPAESPNIVESKSFKLYLGSFAQTAFDSIDDVRAAIKRDVSAICGVNVSVQLAGPADFGKLAMEEFDGLSLDRLDLDTDVYSPDPSLLKAVHDEAPVDETLFSNSVEIELSGDRAAGLGQRADSLLRRADRSCGFAAVYRFLSGTHRAFMNNASSGFSWISCRECRPERLAVYARYTRRGGLDINPFRTNFNLPMPDNARLARQ